MNDYTLGADLGREVALVQALRGRYGRQGFDAKYLLQEIREAADNIEELIKKLEESRKKVLDPNGGENGKVGG